jgi:hypothetical protein
MKKILKPKQQEEANYFSDFTGQPFDEYYGPAVELKVNFNYGSKYDCSEFTLHLSDKDIEPILDLIQSKLNSDFKKGLHDFYLGDEEQLQNAIEARDHMECEHRISNMRLINRLLGNEEYD